MKKKMLLINDFSYIFILNTVIKNICDVIIK